MVHKRMLMIGLALIGLALISAACGGEDNLPSAAEPSATAVSQAEADVESVATEVEEHAEEIAESAEEAAATAEQTADEVATEVSEAETVAEEVEGQASAEIAPLIQVTSETLIGDVIDSNNPTHVTLSTSGSQLVWPQAEGRFWNREGELCTYTFKSAATACAIAPDSYYGYPYAFYWSSNDNYIAFTENPIQQGNESDIWIFEPAEQKYVNLTDDGVEGDWFSAEPGSFALDYLPMWSPQADEIYFWRSIPNPNMPISLTLSIMRVTPEDGNAELVREVQDVRGGDLIWFDDEMWYMDGVSALSPDGRHVAVLAMSEDSESGITAGDGLWLIDLRDDTAPPRHLVTGDDFQMAIPDWSSAPLVPSGLSWHAGGKQLVVLAQNNDQQIPVTVLYGVSVADGTITPVVDFSAVPDAETYMGQGDEAGVPLRVYSPWTASMDPSGETLLMYQNLGGDAGLMASPLPPTGELPGLDYQSQFQNTMPTTRSSRGEDGKVLMYNILFNLVPQ